MLCYVFENCDCKDWLSNRLLGSRLFQCLPFSIDQSMIRVLSYQHHWPDLAGDLAGDLGKLDLAGDLGKLTGDLGGFGLEAFLVVLGGLDRDLGRD